MSDLPTVDSILGPERALPTVDAILGPERTPNPAPTSPFDGTAMDEYFSAGSVGHILNLFGQGAKDGWGAKPLGLNPQQDKELREAGIIDYPETRTTLIKTFNEALIRGGAAALDAALRVPLAGIRGVSEVAVGLGAPRDLTPQALFEAFPAGRYTGFPARIHPHLVPLDRAADLGVIGKGEAGYRGIEPEIASAEAARRLEPTGIETPTERVGGSSVLFEAPQSFAEPNVHQVARQMAPEVFSEFDALSARKDTLTQWINEAAEARRSSPEAQRLQEQMDTIMGRVHGREVDLTTAAQRRYNTAYFALHDLLTQDTPELARLRTERLQTDFQMRDLAPQVSEAYGRARGMVPEEPRPVTEPPLRPGIEATVADTPAAAAETSPSPVSALSVLRAPEPITRSVVPNIAADVSQKLVDAGRPIEEANAAAALVDAHYEARAARFGGARGTAQEMYAADAPDIRGGVTKRSGLAGQTALSDSRATITLFAKADASTFIHETGHGWLEELLTDAKHDLAPPDLVGDAQAARSWLGVSEDAPISTRAHEKFAQGFERYLMEGRAPSQALADIFAKFRDWLTQIYQTVARLRAPITDEVRGVYDRLLVRQGETVVTPESPAREFVSVERRGVYERVPAEPRRLVDFLRREGGLQDAGDELSHIIGGKNQRPGLINARGKSLDDAALRAWEEGYFPEHGENRPTINDLLDAIREDVGGRARYSHQDSAMAEAYRQAIEKNSEIDRLAGILGVNPRHYTREQFFDLVSEQLSLEEQARTIGALEAETERNMAEAELAAKDWTASRGDAWEPDAIYGTVDARPLEDLENAYQQETAVAREPRESTVGAVAAGNAAGGEGSLQGGVRQGGRGAGATGRTGPGAGEAPAGAAASFGRTDAGLIDKAGNIRIDNLNIPEDVARAIREAAEANGGFIDARRGALSDGEVLSLADSLGMDASILNQRKLGEAFNAEEVIAARKLLIRSATEVRDAMAKAAEGSDADVVAYAEAKARHILIQEQVSGLTAEAGRALRAFRSLEGTRDAQEISQFLQEQTGRTLNQLRREAQLGLKLNTPQQLSKFIHDAEKPTWKDYIVEAWINALLSGPMTHVKNIVGNAFVATTSIAETAGAAAVGAIRQAIIPGAAAERVFFAETEARLFGLIRGSQEGTIAFGKALMDENTIRYGPHTIEQRRFQSIPSVKVNIAGIDMELGGKQIRLPGRFLTAEDELFKAIATRQEINALAYRQAISEGLAGDARVARIADLIDNPTERLLDDAHKVALYQTFQNSLGRTGTAVQMFSNSHFLAKIIFPFVRTPINILKYANERTPFGLLSREVRDNLAGHNGAVARDTQISRMALGSMVATATVALAADGLVTGGGPMDANERAALRRTGWQPYSIKIGNMYYSFGWLDPLGTIVGTAADITDVAKASAAKEAEFDKVAGMIVGSLSKNLMSKASLRGASDLVQTLTDPDRYGPRYVQNLIGSLVPSVLAQTARIEDPVMREARTTLDALRARIPGLREGLHPRRDLWGEPIVNQGAFGPDILSPILQSQTNNDPVNRLLVALPYSPAPPDRKIRGVELTDQQYDDFSRISGRMAKMSLNTVVSQITNSAPMVQHRVIQNIISTSREAAAAQIMMQSVGTDNDIIKKASDTKVDALKKPAPTLH